MMSALQRRGRRYRETQAIAPIVPPTSRLPANLAKRFEKKTDGFIASPQQEAVFDWVDHGTGNLILLAGAGCGKTETLVRALQRMQGTISVQAYNKSAAVDFTRKAQKLRADRAGVRIATVHSSGYYCFRSAFPKVGNPDDRKVAKLIDAFRQEAGTVAAGRSGAIEQASGFIRKLVSFGKQFLIGCSGKPPASHRPVWEGLCDHFSIDQDLAGDIKLEDAIGWAIEIFERSRLACPESIDFDDMIYAPIAYNIRIYQNDWVLVDEAQDINPARRELARRLLRPNGRAIFVGDNRQSIYGFTGAGGDSLDRIKEEFSCAVLPLSVTYRCPKAVVAYVHQYVGEAHIQAHTSAPEGVVRAVRHETPTDGPTPSWFAQDPPSKADVILCRYTRPLIQTAYQMIKAGIACRVEGRDIGLGLIALANTWKISTLDKLSERLDVYLRRELEKAAKSGSERRAQEVEDRVGTLRVFIERCRGLGQNLISDLTREVQNMFQDDVTDMLTLCTGHKSKGREWRRVYWIRTSQRAPSRKPWENEQEININYVIGTRAMAELIFVPEGLVGPSLAR